MNYILFIYLLELILYVLCNQLKFIYSSHTKFFQFHKFFSNQSLKPFEFLFKSDKYSTFQFIYQALNWKEKSVQDIMRKEQRY